MMQGEWRVVPVLAALGATAIVVCSSWPLAMHLLLRAVALAVLGLAVAYHRRLRIILTVLPRDLRGIYRFVLMQIQTKRMMRNNCSVVSEFDALVKKHPDKPCFMFQDSVWTYNDLHKYSLRVANALEAEGYHKGDVVALMLGNCVEYVGLWLGMARIGLVTALINHNLRKQPLLHTLKVCVARAVIFGDEFASAIEEIRSLLDPSLVYFQLNCKGNETSDFKNLDALISSAPVSLPSAEPPTFQDQLLYIYTSGTTGLPKAAMMPHSRFLLVGAATRSMLELRNDDVFYTPLPLYHTAGCVIGAGCALVNGVPCVIRKKFSASSYWSDCVHYKCTIGQYIGELCRYLLSVPPKPEDKAHKVRIMLGNGMRRNIWKTFVDRFNIKDIRELYGATEGNTNLVNLDNKIGAVGFLPQILPEKLFPVALIKVDEETHEVIRDKNGLCQKCSYGEPGIVVGKIITGDETRQFYGYVDKEESRKKILHDVFKKGDRAFFSGDVMVMDEYGYLYFKDRIGDTFRWKGENVATAEVETIISNLTGYHNITVYGVEVPGAEGRAGMAALEDPDRKIDLKKLAEGLATNLPHYARPMFLRVVKSLELTGTFKIKKTAIQKEGFDPALIKDDLYFHDGKEFVPLTQELYNEIVSGKFRL
ncbi:long-chain fatty acid transport protein 4-like [Schistocerca americana]|uniref:long-chain fatty acid transport protein 4-like n=1 Tax=Schistocerca americana TaxID=7009 RepID=UPI001F4F33A9|nr:long-chain fatty acid transport protein 4-like [Schistocerca americana]